MSEEQFGEQGSGGLDPATAAYVGSRLASEQSVVGGALAGLVAAAAGAAAWAAVTVVTGWQIGFMAIGVGFLVGYAVRWAGRGVTPVFGVLGAALALAGCAVGNLLAVTAVLAAHESVPFVAAVQQLTPELAQQLVVATFSFMDVVFYGIAAYEGYQLSFRELSPQELEKLTQGGA